MQEIKNKEVKNEQGTTEVNKTRVLTKKDVTKTYLRWWWTAELSNSFERMQALAVCASFTPDRKSTRLNSSH